MILHNESCLSSSADPAQSRSGLLLHPEQHIRGQPSEREYHNLSDEKAEEGNGYGYTGCDRLLEEPNATGEFKVPPQMKAWTYGNIVFILFECWVSVRVSGC